MNGSDVADNIHDAEQSRPSSKSPVIKHRSRESSERDVDDSRYSRLKSYRKDKVDISNSVYGVFSDKTQKKSTNSSPHKQKKSISSTNKQEKSTSSLTKQMEGTSSTCKLDEKRSEKSSKENSSEKDRHSKHYERESERRSRKEKESLPEHRTKVEVNEKSSRAKEGNNRQRREKEEKNISRKDLPPREPRKKDFSHSFSYKSRKKRKADYHSLRRNVPPWTTSQKYRTSSVPQMTQGKNLIQREKRLEYMLFKDQLDKPVPPPRKDVAIKKVTCSSNWKNFKRTVIVSDGRIEFYKKECMKSFQHEILVFDKPQLVLDDLIDFIKQKVDLSTPVTTLLICSVGTYDLIRVKDIESCQHVSGHKPFKMIVGKHQDFKHGSSRLIEKTKELKKKLKKVLGSDSEVYFTTINYVNLDKYHKNQMKLHKETNHELDLKFDDEFVDNLKTVSMELRDSILCYNRFIVKDNLSTFPLDMKMYGSKENNQGLSSIAKDGFVMNSDECRELSHGFFQHLEEFLTKKSAFEKVVFVGDSRIDHVRLSWPSDTRYNCKIITEPDLTLYNMTNVDDPVMKELCSSENSLIIIFPGIKDFCKLEPHPECKDHKKLEVLVPWESAPVFTPESRGSRNGMYKSSERNKIFVYMKRILDHMANHAPSCEVLFGPTHGFDLFSHHKYEMKQHQSKVKHAIKNPLFDEQFAKFNVKRLRALKMMVDFYNHACNYIASKYPFDLRSLAVPAKDSNAQSIPLSVLYDGVHPSPDLAIKLAEEFQEFAAKALKIPLDGFNTKGPEIYRFLLTNHLVYMWSVDKSEINSFWHSNSKVSCSSSIVEGRYWEEDSEARASDSSDEVLPSEDRQNRDLIQERLMNISQNSALGGEGDYRWGHYWESPLSYSEHRHFPSHRTGHWSHSRSPFSPNRHSSYSSRTGHHSHSPSPPSSRNYMRIDSYPTQENYSYSPDLSRSRHSRWLGIGDLSRSPSPHWKSPETSYGRISPEPYHRRRNPEIFPQRRSPETSYGRISPEPYYRRRNPESSEACPRRRSPQTSYGRISPEPYYRRRNREISPQWGSPEASLRRRSPKTFPRKRSPETLALESLREVHNKECELYINKPTAHPDYDKEFRKYREKKRDCIVALGGDPDSYDITKDWELYWPSRLKELFEDSWVIKRDTCLKMLKTTKLSKSLSPLSAKRQQKDGGKLWGKVSNLSPSNERERKFEPIVKRKQRRSKYRSSSSESETQSDEKEKFMTEREEKRSQSRSSSKKSEKKDGGKLWDKVSNLSPSNERERKSEPIVKRKQRRSKYRSSSSESEAQSDEKEKFMTEREEKRSQSRSSLKKSEKSYHMKSRSSPSSMESGQSCKRNRSSRSSSSESERSLLKQNVIGTPCKRNRSSSSSSSDSEQSLPKLNDLVAARKRSRSRSNSGSGESEIWSQKQKYLRNRSRSRSSSSGREKFSEKEKDSVLSKRNRSGSRSLSRESERLLEKKKDFATLQRNQSRSRSSSLESESLSLRNKDSVDSSERTRSRSRSLSLERESMPQKHKDLVASSNRNRSRSRSTSWERERLPPKGIEGLSRDKEGFSGKSDNELPKSMTSWNEDDVWKSLGTYNAVKKSDGKLLLETLRNAPFMEDKKQGLPETLFKDKIGIYQDGIEMKYSVDKDAPRSDTKVKDDRIQNLFTSSKILGNQVEGRLSDSMIRESLGSKKIFDDSNKDIISKGPFEPPFHSRKEDSSLEQHVAKKPALQNYNLGLFPEVSQNVNTRDIDAKSDTAIPKASSSVASKDESADEVTSTTPSFGTKVQEDLVDVLQILVRLGDRLDMLKVPLKFIYEKALSYRSMGSDSYKVLDDEDSKTLLQMVSSKLSKLVEDKNMNIVQKVIMEETNERLHNILKCPSPKVDISAIAKNCLGKNTADTVAYIQSEFLDKGSHSVSPEQLESVYAAVKSEKSKLLSKILKQSSSMSVDSPSSSRPTGSSTFSYTK